MLHCQGRKAVIEFIDTQKLSENNKRFNNDHVNSQKTINNTKLNENYKNFDTVHK